MRTAYGRHSTAAMQYHVLLRRGNLHTAGSAAGRPGHIGDVKPLAVLSCCGFLMLCGVNLHGSWFDNLGIGVSVRSGNATAVVGDAGNILGVEYVDVYYGKVGSHQSNSNIYVGGTVNSLALDFASKKHRVSAFFGYEVVPLTYGEKTGTFTFGDGSSQTQIVRFGFESEAYLAGFRLHLWELFSDDVLGRMDMGIGGKLSFTRYYRMYFDRRHINSPFYTQKDTIIFEPNLGGAVIADVSYRLPFLPITVGLELESGTRVIEEKPEVHYGTVYPTIINQGTPGPGDETWTTGGYYSFNVSLKAHFPLDR